MVVYPNDHRPPHVHVIGSVEHARFELRCGLKKVQMLSSIGLRLRQIQQIENYLLRHLGHLCDEWERIHGYR